MTETASYHPVRYGLVLVAYAAIVIGGGYLGDWISQTFNITIWPHNEPTLHIAILAALVAYVMLTAFPFVPGVELGLALIMAFGAKIVGVVYFATVLSLTIAFLIGRLVPERWLATAFAWMGMTRASRLVTQISSLSGEQRVQHLISNAPRTWLPWLLKYRLWALAILFNLPGSSLLGGGGGIAMAAGMSRLVTFPKYFICVVFAVSPVPVAILISTAMGKHILN